MDAPLATPAVERLGAYLRRRDRSGLALHPGEVVTLIVGVLRGCQDAEDRARGSVWGLTAHGCPVLREDPGGSDALEATASVLAQLAEMVPGEGGCHAARARDAVLTQPPRTWDDMERRLFAWAEPVPLVLGPLAPRDGPGPDETERPRVAPSPLFALVDADLATWATEIVRELRARWGSSRRGKVITVAGAATVAALAAAAMLPSSPQEDASVTATPSSVTMTSAPGVAATTAPPTPGDLRPVPTPTDQAVGDEPAALDPPSSADDDIVTAATRLLTTYTACAGDTSCEQTLREGRADPDEAPPADPAHAHISLVDDFGGLAVVRLDDGASAQYVTLVREKDRWLVRAVRTVADQPS